MARKKELSKQASTSKSVKELDKTQDMDSEDAPDISKLRRMPTDDLMGEEKGTNVRRSSRTQAVESVKRLTSTLSKKALVHARSSLRGKNMQRSFTKVKASTVSKPIPKHLDKFHTTAGLTLLGKSKMHTRTSITAKTKQVLSKKKQSDTEKDISKSVSIAPQKTLSKRASSQAMQEKVSAELKGRNKFLWFPKDAILAVRTETDDFYLCRSRTNVYNYTKQMKVNWLVKKPKKYKIQNCYKLGYRDVIHPASVLMHVNMIRLSRVTFQLPNDQVKDIKKLLQIAIDVEKGEKTLDQVDDDVEQVILIDQPAPKKPRLIKTASQKLRDKERRANKKKEPKEAKKPREKKKRVEKQGEPERKRKVPARKGISLDLHPRPDIKVLTHDPLFESREPMPYVSKTANSRLVYRAIYLKDNKLLRKLLKDGSYIYELYPKSLDNEETPASAAGRAGDKAILLTLLEEYFGKKFADRLKNNRGDRHFLDKLGTGKYNRRSLGINFIRKIMASRGSREGNNAFTASEDSVDYSEREFLKQFLRTNSNPELLETIEKYFEANSRDMFSDIFSNQDVHELLLQGRPDIAGKIIQVWLKYSRQKVTPLFRDVLLFTNEELSGCSPSNLSFVSKTINKLSVFHCAAANSNSKYLEKLLSIQPDVHIVDSKGNRPLHFAAACSSPDNVQLLLNMGGNFNDTNASRKLPLHIAIEANRPQNVKLLLEAAAKNPGKDPFAFKFGTGGVNRPDSSSHSPLHIAADMGFTEVAEILLKFGANVNAKLNVSKNQLTPLMSAAAQENLKMVKLLVQYGADVEQKDRMERRAVIHACMNGSTSVLSYLLNIGASPEHPDSSGNSPLHYAAAYGWFFTVKLLLDAGVDPNANNMWKLTPLSVAYLKSQIGIVQLLLNYKNVDINFADDNGKTLLFHACESDLLQQDLLEQIKYIIEVKGALSNIIDKYGQTPLHCLANNQVKVDDEEKANQGKLINDAFKQSLLIAELLIKYGCDPTVVDENNNTAAMVAISRVTNLPLCEYLLERGSPVMPPVGLVPTTTILHAIANSIWQAPENLNSILFLLEKYNHFNIILIMANYVDSVGFTPLQTACLTIKQGAVPNYQNIEDRKLLKKNWDDVRAFIKTLVEELGCDVNAKVQKRYFDIEDMPAPNSHLWWLNPETAGKTAAHIAMLGVDPEFDSEFNVLRPGTSGQMIFKDLVLHGTDLNVLDESGNSPLSTCILNDRSDLFEFMASEGQCDFNLKVEVNKDEFVHPLILAASRFSSHGKKNADVICQLIECGCDLNCETSDTKKKILHCVAAEPEAQAREEVLKIVNKLAEKGYNFNSLDGKKRTALHYALKANNGGLNQSYELEVKLIQQGTDLGLKDKYGRTALHYIFKTTAPPTNNPFMGNRGNMNVATNDPAELTKLIGRNMSVLDINERDKYGQTVLHRAAKQGATFCCMYLTLVGAAVNIEDNNKNTALSLAVQNKHDVCATTLIQAGANLKLKVLIIAQEDKSLKVAKKKLKEQNAEEKSEEIKEIWQWQPNTLIKVDEPVRTLSLYQAAIEFDLPGVAMFVTEASQAKSGLTQADAISIAFKSCKYNIALRLLCTTTDRSLLHIRREHGRSLLHLLALSGADYTQKEDPVIVKISEFLLNAGLSATEGDEFNCNPILYAVLNRLFPLADILAEKSHGYDVKYTDSFQRSYLAAALWRCHSNKINQACWDFIETLIKAKMDINQFFDLPLNPDLATIVGSDKKQDPDYWQSYPNVKTTALFGAICCGEFTISQNLLVAGANPNLADGNSLTPLMYAVKLGRISQVRQLLNYEYDPLKSHKTELNTQSAKKKNWSKSSRAVFKLRDTEMESDDSSDSSEESMEVDETEKKKKKTDDEFFTMKKTSSVKLNAKDIHGRTALHHVAQTHSNGTFDNEEAAFVLVKGGAKLTADATGINPYQLALNSHAIKVAEVIRKHFNLQQKKPPENVLDNEVMDEVPEEFETWPEFQEASEKILRRYDSGHVLQDVYLHEIDSNCNIKDGELLKDEQQDIYYDVLMTKVDVKHLEWGLYNFYQMQIVSQPRKSLFILFTRWGRIEDKGQFQHTPFSTKEEAVKEFMKIFREKSGNKWTDVKNFEKKPYKYRLIEDAARKAPAPQKEVDFDLESNVPSRMPNDLHRLVETMMNPKAMQLSMNKAGKMELTLALGQLNKELLMRGKNLLDQIEKLVQEVENYRKLPKDNREESVHKDAFQNNLEKIAELSNEYFHVIPTKNFSCEKIRPLDQRHKLMTQMHNLSNLLDYEIASKMLLAAMHYRTVYNPIDYVYRSIGCKIQRMNPTDEMSQMILKYITISGSVSKVHGIYKLRRQGENERLAATRLGDRRLLWHGTNTCNLMSILNRGLVICPPEAQMTGWAYGKGIYFSDAFAKSASYVRTDGASSYMLLCEVALGELLDFNKSKNEKDNEKRLSNHNSVEVRNHHSYYNSSDWFYLQSGVCLPQDSLKQIVRHMYTQYVVLDPAQVCLRYLVEFSQ